MGRVQLLRQLRKTMLAELKQHVHELAPQEYTDTVRIVKNLTSEFAAERPQQQIADR